ncbi:MAG: biotin/lipoyl-binding protein, partial [Pseudomonadota bacterium]|nr:biotin/lipoyl-binding protein [Pseudomonadota bacterium]
MTKQQTRNRAAQWAAASAMGAVALGLSGWGMHTLHAGETAAPAAASPVLRHEGARLVVPPGSALRSSVQVAPVTRGDVDVPFTLPAVVEAEPGRVAKVLTPLTGRIVSVNKHLGDTVRAGDVLFTIDAPDLAQAAADAAKADAALVLAQRNLERQVALDAADIASKRDLEQARNDASQAASEAARASARLVQL